MPRSSTSRCHLMESRSLFRINGERCSRRGKMTASPNRVSPTEQSLPAQIGAVLFRHRGWLPLLFLGIPLVMKGSTSPFRWEVGIALIVIGEAIRLARVAAAGTVTRRRSRNVQRLVTYGIFAWARNP